MPSSDPDADEILGDEWPLTMPGFQNWVADERAAAEHEAIRAPQLAFNVVVDGFIEVYRTLDRTRRVEIKKKLKALYEELKVLGEKIGVSRFGLDSIWAG